MRGWERLGLGLWAWCSLSGALAQPVAVTSTANSTALPGTTTTQRSDYVRYDQTLQTKGGIAEINLPLLAVVSLVAIALIVVGLGTSFYVLGVVCEKEGGEAKAAASHQPSPAPLPPPQPSL